MSAWLSAGEAAMDGGDLATATASYRNIVDEAPDARVAPYALYKLAWCDRNAGRTDDAIRDLELLLEWARSGDVPGAVPLIEAATADLERFGEALAATPAEPLTER